ncbi:MAG: NAD(P)-dependent oxidoreductase [Acidimicrobiales bacterium]|nr:NAD(P)-dependent oxidoreductase [Acidimicrobiales bacterium]
MKLAFVGLGNMGQYMAANLLAAGHEMRVHDLRREAANRLVEEGATWADSVASACEGVEAVFLSLPAPPDVEKVVTGPDGVLAGLASGATIIDLSTNSPSMVRKLAKLAADKGIGFLDAPVSGGTRGAREATLAVMVGGDADLYARFEPVLKAIGPNVFNTGDIGTGNVAKLINNQLAFINMMAMNEALLMGAKAGIDLVMLRNIVRASSGDSFAWIGGAVAVLKDKLPTRFSCTLAAKDIGLAQELADETGVDSKLGRLTYEMIKGYRDNGFADQDILATIKACEEQAGYTVRGLWHE